MSDLISRQAAIDALDEIEAEVADGYGYQYAKWREYFVEMPSAQPEIIRCKDCNWYREGVHLSPNKFCYRLKDNSGKRIGYNFADNDFCSRAERRNDG